MKIFSPIEHPNSIVSSEEYSSNTSDAASPEPELEFHYEHKDTILSKFIIFTMTHVGYCGHDCKRDEKDEYVLLNMRYIVLEFLKEPFFLRNLHNSGYG
ncbi:490_t:CDS:2, partial [Gigaspora margarita]